MRVSTAIENASRSTTASANILVLVVLAACVLGGAATTARAAVFCPSSTNQLIADLAAALANDENDQIRIVAGTYNLTSTLFANTTRAEELVISGGWNANCTVRNGGDTVLDGGSQKNILYLSANSEATLVVRFITFANGKADGSNGSPNGAILAATNGRMFIENNWFVANKGNGQSGVGAVYMNCGGLCSLRNNVFIGNSAAAAGAARVYSSHVGTTPYAYVSGNTFIANTSTGAVGALYVSSYQGKLVVRNNILWNNTGGDLGGLLGLTTLLNNDIGVNVASGMPQADSAGNLSVNPGFAPGFLNLHLAPASPLVNAGVDENISGNDGIGDYDLDGNPRWQGAHPDIGAFETDVLLRNGFDGVVLE